MGAFVFGFLLGLLTALALLGFGVYLVCRQANKLAIARFLSSIAIVLAEKAKSAAKPRVMPPSHNGELVPLSVRPEGGS